MFKVILGLRKLLKSISKFKWDSQIFKIARSYNQKPAASFNMSNRWFCYTNSLFDQGLGDHKGISTTLNHFENFLIPFWILKIFCNPKIILKIFVIQIQFWNWFQTIEVQVISCSVTLTFNAGEPRLIPGWGYNFTLTTTRTTANIEQNYWPALL